METSHGLLWGCRLEIFLRTWSNHGLWQVALQLIEHCNVRDPLVQDILVIRNTSPLLAATLHIECLESTSEWDQLLFLRQCWCWFNWLYGILVIYRWRLHLLYHLWLCSCWVVIMEGSLVSQVKWVIVFLYIFNHSLRSYQHIAIYIMRPPAWLNGTVLSVMVSIMIP